MSDIKWTFGPWWVEDADEICSSGSGGIVAKDGDWEICTMSRCDENAIHDAHLIAAAPELYSTLDAMSKGEGLPPGMTIEGVLAKARGESQ